MTLLVALTLSGCSDTAAQGTPSTPSTPRQQINVNEISQVTSLSDLTKRSQAVVVGVAGRRTTTELRSLPVTMTEVAPVKTVAGKLRAGGLTVSQLGSEQVLAPGLAQVMTSGATYLLFLAEETSDGARRTVLAGGRGLYEQRGDQYVYVGGEGSALPATLPVESIESRIPAMTKK
ncbi:hypothetical protein GCM10009741_04600 [Kribbella lupini]|uniref:Lipoprotein n=1 Tax=Kribbella lupini TaxID=291602 RepID=A0ABN2A3A9_9ACTN